MRIGLLMVLVGCAGDDEAKTDTGLGDDDDDVTGDDDDTTGDDDDDVTTDTGPTTPPLQWNVHLAADFGIDASGALSAVDVGGVLYEPAIQIYVGSIGWNGDLADTINYCTIVLPLDTATPAPWVAGEKLISWGVDYDIAMQAPTTDCPDPTDPNGPGDVVGDFVTAEPDWGLGIGQPTSLVGKILGPTFGADMVYVHGAQLRTANVFGAVVPDGYAFAYAVDAKMVTVVDGDGLLVPLDASGFPAKGDPPSAWYTVSSLTYWSVLR